MMKKAPTYKMLMKNILTVAAVLLFSTFFCSAPAADEATDETTEKKEADPEAYKLYLTPVPVIGVNPAFGFIYGVGASASMYIGNPKTTRLSNLLAGLAKTTQGQLITTLKSTAYVNDDSFILNGDWRYLDSSQPTYGLGTGPDSSKLVTSGQDIEYDDDLYSGTFDKAQMMGFTYIRFYQTVLKRIKDSTYFGFGYHLDHYSDIDDQLLDLNASPQVIPSHYAYSINNGFDPEKSVLSGVSASFAFDSRDNVINPYSGRYMNASYRYNPEVLGSDKNSSTLWLEYRDYYVVTPDHNNIIAVWLYGNFLTSGELPYMDLAATSYDQYAKSGRGYVQGRFRGEHMAYSEIEYRHHLADMWHIPVGMVVYANAQTLSSKGNDIDLFEYVEFGGGAGLRFMLNKQTRTNLTLDYAIGEYASAGLYIRLNETF